VLGGGSWPGIDLAAQEFARHASVRALVADIPAAAERMGERIAESGLGETFANRLLTRITEMVPRRPGVLH
jgi:hypothetical protein